MGSWDRTRVQAGTAGEGPADHVYHAPGGFVYTSERISSPSTTRPSAALLVSANGRAFELSGPQGVLRGTAALVRPLVARGLQAQGVALVSANIHPTHPAYTWLARGDDPPIQALPREAFAAQDAVLLHAVAGRLGRAEGVALLQALLTALQPLLPPPPPEHPLRPALLAWLRRHPQATLGELAAGVGVSYHRMSHLFTEAMGIPFRGWSSFERLVRAARRFEHAGTLTGIAHDSGYTDSAHLSRTWQRVYGLTPSFVRSGNSVQATH